MLLLRRWGEKICLKDGGGTQKLKLRTIFILFPTSLSLHRLLTGWSGHVVEISNCGKSTSMIYHIWRPRKRICHKPSKPHQISFTKPTSTRLSIGISKLAIFVLEFSLIHKNNSRKILRTMLDPGLTFICSLPIMYVVWAE